MLRAISITAFLACASCVAVLLSVHAEARARERLLDARVFTFPRAGIVLQPGAAWRPFGSVATGEPDSTLCAPQVEGPGRFVVRLLPVGLTVLSQAAEVGRAEFASDVLAVAGSFREEEFVSTLGLRGRHLCYQRRAGPPRAPLPFQKHTYLVTNRAGRVVAIEHGEWVPADQRTAERILRSLDAL